MRWPDRRLAERPLGNLLDDSFYFLDRETYDASTNLDCLGAVRLQLDVLQFWEDERAEL